MKRYGIAFLVFMVATGILAGCGRTSDIGKEKAVEIALEDAQLSESEVIRLHVSRDKEDNQTVYEIQFAGEDTEYEYEIFASNGDILSTDYEKLDTAQQAAAKEQDRQEEQYNSGEQNGQREQNSSGEQDGQREQGSAQITIEEASELALKRVPGADAGTLKIELDYDDGIYKYEGDIIYEGKEYDFEIDAKTGDFLEWKEERR